ncbi:MAG TPA: cation diffusion facilitator family transporter [Candidatus Sumerlaeota bacterium]|nr:cation diffusion facilitator family transporter [Candidatus Sumerlaeota bacterium]HOR26559.1 cation diffusion facilitator family transporter [Candidatus Sumerlaeota bacterium]HPK00878.1 cation diffusion facilitator family transporter [Candidatus Sumerlaeota bacterium]
MAREYHEHPTDLMSDARLWWAVAVNLLLTVAQVIGGGLAGSLALVADALHNLNDAASLGIALAARRISRRPPDRLRTFGYRRAQIIGALINLTALILVALYLVFEAVLRWFERNPIDGWIVVWLAGLALAVDLATALLTYTMSRTSLNIKAAFIHNLSDALASVGVMLAGTLILLYEWYWTDLAVTLLISAYILWQSVGMLKETIHILMQGTPSDVRAEEIAAALETVAAVRELHHVHVWQIDEHHRSFEGHVVIGEASLPEMECIKRDLRAILAERFQIQHSTLEVEIAEQLNGIACARREHAH